MKKFVFSEIINIIRKIVPIERLVRLRMKTAAHREKKMKKKILAIDIGGSKMLAGIVEMSRDGNTEEGAGWKSTILSAAGESLPAEMTEEKILEKIRTLAASAAAQIAGTVSEKEMLQEIDAVGVTIPGLADERVWIYAPFSGIQNFPIAEALEQEFGRPVFIENDVNACAIAEGLLGACRGVRDFIWLTISNGIGGGVVLDGRIYRGAKGFSGEFGHLCVAEDGELCGCGKRGCLEAECAGPGISRFYARLTGEKIPASEIAERAEAGEPAALETFRREGKVLGRALANAANILNPARIILGGGVARAWDLFYPTLEETFRKDIFRRANEDVLIERTALGYEAALLGAAVLPIAD